MRTAASNNNNNKQQTMIDVQQVLQQYVSILDPPPVAETFQVGDLVEAFDLVGASHLNGQYAWVKQTANGQGRVTVQFLNDDTPKLIKQSNLKVACIPSDKDDPRYFFTDDHGKIYMLRIENGAGLKCVDCGMDLGGQYYVQDNGVYRCEKDFWIQSAGLAGSCIVCKEFLPLRQTVKLPASKVHTVYPSVCLPLTDQFERQEESGVNYVYLHSKCYTCQLCKRRLACKPVDSVRLLVLEDRLSFLCKAPPHATEGCANEWEEYIDARKRLAEIDVMNVEDLQALLQDRNVRFTLSEEKESLVRKVFLTDQKKGRKISACCTDVYGKAIVVGGRVARAAVIRDRSCTHGFCKPVPCRRAYQDARRAYSLFIVEAAHYFLGGDFATAFELTVAFWTCRVPLVRAHIDSRLLPSHLWQEAVSGFLTVGGTDSASLGLVTSVLVIGAMMETLVERPDFTEEDGQRLLKEPALKRSFQAITAGPLELAQFMHHPDRRRCNCMAFAVTEAELGSNRWTCSKLTTSPVEHCALCDQGLANPLVCSSCKEVAYCNRSHQVEHWKVHKKACSGRAKKQKD